MAEWRLIPLVAQPLKLIPIFMNHEAINLKLAFLRLLEIVCFSVLLARLVGCGLMARLKGFCY